MCHDENLGAFASTLHVDVAQSIFAALPLDKLVDLLGKASKNMISTLTESGYGADYEDEADAYGTRYLAASGYSALGIADYLRRVQADPAFTSATSKTHPPAAERAAKIEKQVTAERLTPPHSPNEPARSKRFTVAFGGKTAAPAAADARPRTN